VNVFSCMVALPDEKKYVYCNRPPKFARLLVTVLCKLIGEHKSVSGTTQADRSHCNCSVTLYHYNFNN
jgi:hypothetical protein